MKNIAPELLSHLQQSVTTLATCFKITRDDGVVLGFTSLDRNLIIDNLIYQSTDSLLSSAIESTADFTPDNLDIQGILSHDFINETDLLSGLYDDATVDVFRVNYNYLPNNLTDKRILWLRRAIIGSVAFENGTFVAELRGLAEKLKKTHLDLFSPTCRVRRLGDNKCGVNTSQYTNNHSVTVTNNDNKSFTASNTQANDYYRLGIIKWKSGYNKGREAVVKAYNNGSFTLTLPCPFPIKIGDSFTATKGCDRQFSTCLNVFNNIKNFRGEPPHLLPGEDKIRTNL